MTQRLITVKLLGELGKKFGREWQLYASTPREAIDLISCQVEGFFAYVYRSSDLGIVYRCVTDDPHGLDIEDLTFPCQDLVIVAPMFAAKGGFGKILVGGALLGLALIPGFLPASLAIGALVLPLASTVASLGAALLFGGITQLLTPKPKDTEQKDSTIFAGIPSTGIQGLPVPILYGEFIVENPIPISFALEIKNKGSTSEYGTEGNEGISDSIKLGSQIVIPSSSVNARENMLTTINVDPGNFAYRYSPNLNQTPLISDHSQSVFFVKPVTVDPLLAFTYVLSYSLGGAPIDLALSSGNHVFTRIN